MELCQQSPWSYAKNARESNGGPIKIISDIEAAYLESFNLICEARAISILIIKAGVQTTETVQRLSRINQKLGKPPTSQD